MFFSAKPVNLAEQIVQLAMKHLLTCFLYLSFFHLNALFNFLYLKKNFQMMSASFNGNAMLKLPLGASHGCFTGQNWFDTVTVNSCTINENTILAMTK